MLVWDKGLNQLLLKSSSPLTLADKWHARDRLLKLMTCKSRRIRFLHVRGRGMGWGIISFFVWSMTCWYWRSHEGWKLSFPFSHEVALLSSKLIEMNESVNIWTKKNWWSHFVTFDPQSLHTTFYIYERFKFGNYFYSFS